MNNNKSIQKAKVRLILTQPFFASLALSMEYTADNSIETACCNGETIRFNESFVNGLIPAEAETLIAHEVLHPGLFHHTRMGDKDPSLWNEACDYAINPLLKEAGFTLPKGALNSDRFKNLSAEAIYKILYDERQQQNQQNQQNQSTGNTPAGNQQQQPGQKPGDWGQVEKPATVGETSMAEAESKMKQKLVQAANAARTAGKLPGGLDRTIKDLIQPKLPWEEITQRYLAELARNDYTWTKPSPRYLYSGLYMPKLENMEVGNIIFSVDTSGSVNRDKLNAAGSELVYASQLFKMPITVIHCDRKIQLVEELDAGGTINPRGGGGTSFVPPFEYIEQNFLEPRAMIYFTDGYCDEFPSFEPPYPVLWLVYNNERFTPPFGEVINL